MLSYYITSGVGITEALKKTKQTESSKNLNLLLINNITSISTEYAKARLARASEYIVMCQIHVHIM